MDNATRTVERYVPIRDVLSSVGLRPSAPGVFVPYPVLRAAIDAAFPGRETHMQNSKRGAYVTTNIGANRTRIGFVIVLA